MRRGQAIASGKPRRVAGSHQKKERKCMSWLYNLPNSCIAPLFGAIGAALFVGVLFFRVKVLRFRIESDHAKSAHDALAVVIGFAGLVLAFSLVREQINVRNIEGTSRNGRRQPR